MRCADADADGANGGSGDGGVNVDGARGGNIDHVRGMVQGVPMQTEGCLGCKCRCGGREWCNPRCERGIDGMGGAANGARGIVHLT